MWLEVRQRDFTTDHFLVDSNALIVIGRVPSTYVVFLDQVASVAVFCDSFDMKRGMYVAMPRNSRNSSASSGFHMRQMSTIRAGSRHTQFASNSKPKNHSLLVLILHLSPLKISPCGMLRCRLHQLIEVGVVFLFGRPEHSYIICDADTA